MVQRVVVRHEYYSAAAGERATETRKKLKRRRDAIIVAIKKQMLRCSEQGRRRFKRGYLAGGDRGDAADSAIFYLACLVCCTAARPSSLPASR